jgi:hypothetical protein
MGCDEWGVDKEGLVNYGIPISHSPLPIPHSPLPSLVLIDVDIFGVDHVIAGFTRGAAGLLRARARRV